MALLFPICTLQAHTLYTPPPSAAQGALQSFLLGCRVWRRVWRLWPTMHSLVLEQVLLLAEAAATDCTQVGPLTSVVAQMAREVGLLAETAATVWAGVGPLARVDALVDGEC